MNQEVNRMKMKSGMEQAVSVLLLLSRLPVQASLTSEAISQRLRVSPSYLKKLMRTLVQAGLAESLPGTKGGFTLTKPLADITLYDVYQAVEGRGSMYQGKACCNLYLRVKVTVCWRQSWRKSRINGPIL